MGTEIGAFAVRRSIWLDVGPERVWREFEDLEHMRAWFGTGHTLVAYEPRVGGYVETSAGMTAGESLRFAGPVTHYEPGRELSFEQDWLGRGWDAAPLITLRLTPAHGGTLVELFHHAFERTGDIAMAATNLRVFEEGWTMRQLEALRERVEGAAH